VPNDAPPLGPTDVSCWIGSYPFRHVPHPDPDVLVRVLAREGIARAWVGSLPAAFHRDPTHANADLLAALAPHAAVLRPVPAIRPDWPGWQRRIAECVDAGAPAVRAYPPQWGYGADEPALRALRDACGEAGLALQLTVRFEDLRQRHAMDGAGDLSAAAIRAVARGNARTRIVVTAAGRELLEEVHWGLTPGERALVWWDISWIWGPPEDHLAHLIRTIGADRLVFGTCWPLRLTQTPRANLDLLPDDVAGARIADPSTW
jgi:predicted TIM-barrel fold metal-dependent hydrolase